METLQRGIGLGFPWYLKVSLHTKSELLTAITASSFPNNTFDGTAAQFIGRNGIQFLQTCPIAQIRVWAAKSASITRAHSSLEVHPLRK